MAPSRKKRRAILVGATMASFATLVACNNIIGLTDFTKGECPGARCDVTEAGPDQVGPDGGEDVRDGSIDVKGADPTTWPNWPMPNYGEGGLGEPPLPLSYADAGADLTDTRTKLTWKTTALIAKATEANAACAALGGYRAPKRIELVSLLDYPRGAGLAYIDPRFQVGGTVWSTSEVRSIDERTGALSITTRFWAVDFGRGEVVQREGSTPNNVLCVKAK